MTERDSVLEWSEKRERLQTYHPLAPVGCYGQAYLRERFAQLVDEQGIALSQMDILDLGSGKGTWCRWFAEIKETTDGIVGIDLDERALAHASALSPIEYVRADMCALPSALPRAGFDFATAFVSLMFLRDTGELDAVFAGVREVLRPGGYFLILEYDTPHDPDASWSGWPASELSARAEAAGFTVLARKGLLKRLLNRFDSYYRASFRNMDWLRACEHVLPGPYQYYYLLLRKPV